MPSSKNIAVPLFIEVWRAECNRRGPPPLYDENGKILCRDPRKTAVHFEKVVQSPELQERVVNKRDLRALKTAGYLK